MFSSSVKLLDGKRVRPLAVSLYCESDRVDSKLTPDRTGCDSTDLNVRTNNSRVLKERKVEGAILGTDCEKKALVAVLV